MRSRIAIALVVAGVLLAAVIWSGSGASDPSPSAASNPPSVTVTVRAVGFSRPQQLVRQVYLQETRNDWATLYRELLPTQAKQIDSDAYARCLQRLIGHPAPPTSIHTSGVYNEPANIGEGVYYPGKAVTLHVESGGSRRHQIRRAVQDQDGLWYQLLDPKQLSSWRDGNCVGPAP